MTHKGTVTLETQRLLLRRFTLEDAEAVYRNWASDPEVTKYLTWQPQRSIEESKAVRQNNVENYQRADYYNWAIVLKELDEPVGAISVVRLNEKTEAVDIGYALGRPWWGKGIVVEVFAEVIRFLFEEVGVQRIAAHHDPNNPASGRVMQKCGLTYEGTLRRCDWNNQGICDAAYYSILRDEYSKNK